MYDEKQPVPFDEEIRARSYRIWQHEGCPEGKAEEHWQRARMELAVDHTASMSFRKQPVPSEECIRARSHVIWDQEGRPEGKAEVHWLRAKAELEDEFCADCAAYIDGKSTTVVPPLLQISSSPSRTQSSKMTPMAEFLQAAG